MSVSEQELFGLMAVAQEQQKAAVVAIERLEAQRAGLEHTVEQARAAVREMEMAGKASALIIEKATRTAVSEAVSSALVAVRDETVKALGGSVKPVVNALDGAAARALQAEQRLNQAAASFSWQWGAIWACTASLLLMVVLGAGLLFVPSPKEIAELRAQVKYLEEKGGKAVLKRCGDDERLCAEIDLSADVWGKNGEFRILKGY